MQARKDLPKIPPEIFSLWFDQIIENNGWVPESPPWPDVLSIPVRAFADYNWREANVDITQVVWGPRSQETFNGLIDCHFRGIHNHYISIFRDSQAKFREITAYLTAQKKLPSKLTLLKTPRGHELLDGFHRVALAIYIISENEGHLTFSPNVAVWEGLPDEQSLP